MTVLGENGENILESWSAHGPKTYLGTMTHGLPNYFTLLGPHTGLGHSSFVFMVECQVNWMLKVLKEMEKQRAGYVSVRKEAEAAYMDWYDQGHNSTVWGNASCGSWYVNSKGKIDTLYPGHLYSFWRLTSSLDQEALEFK